MKQLLTAALLLGAASVASAQQVGYDPVHSAYRDVDQTMEWALLYGHFSARSDPAGVAPQSGGLAGLLFDWHAGGPIYLTSDFTRIASQRLVIDPTVPAAKRDLGTAYWPLYALEGGMELSFPGNRTWHGFMPMLTGGLGVVSDRHSQADVGDYSFGTRFDLTWGAAVRWIPGNRWGLRADLNNRFYSMSYPEAYYHPASDNSTVLPPQASKSFWRNNPSLSIGITYMPGH